MDILTKYCATCLTSDTTKLKPSTEPSSDNIMYIEKIQTCIPHYVRTEYDQRHRL